MVTYLSGRKPWINPEVVRDLDQGDGDEELEEARPGAGQFFLSALAGMSFSCPNCSVTIVW
jgi:hypothetical protein